MTQMIDVTLPGPAPWGFRLAGGKDFNTPIHISKTTPNGKAAYEGVMVGDVVCAINGHITSSMTHFEAQDVIKDASRELKLKIRRGGGYVESPNQKPVQFPSAPPPTRRMEPEVLPPPNPGATIVHKQFNSPVGLYSADNIADAFKGQVEGMGIDAGATKLPATPMSPMSPTMSPMSPGFGSQGYSSGPSYGAPRSTTPFGAPQQPAYSRPKPMAQVYSGHAPRAQTYAPPRRPPPIVNRPKPQQKKPAMEQRPQKAFSGNPAVKSRSFRMLEEMTQEDEARALEEMQMAQKAADYEASQQQPHHRRAIDDYEPYDGRSRGPQSRSFKMLQQMTAEEEAMMEDL